MSKKMHRRKFLKSTLVAGTGASAGIVLAQSNAGCTQKDVASEQELVNVAIIGCGEQGRTLLQGCKNIPNLRFKAVCDIWERNQRRGQAFAQNANRNPEDPPEEKGFRPNVYEDYREMLANENGLDAVIVATPDWMHAEHTNACLEHGVDVYCEKMMSNDVEEARSMVRTMEKTGKLLQIGHQRRSNPYYLHALHNLMGKAQLFGRITNVNGQWNRAVSEPRGWPKNSPIPEDKLHKYGYENMLQFRNWRWYKKYGGGPISDLGAHQIDIYNWFLGGPPKTVMAGGGINYYDNYEWYDNVMAIYEYETPAGIVRAFYQVLTTTSAGGGYTEDFMGTKGTLKMSENPDLTKVYREPRVPEEEWSKWVQANYIKQQKVEQDVTKIDVRETAPLAVYDLPSMQMEKPHVPHLKNFFAAVRGEAELNCPADHAFKSEAAVFKVNEAVEAEKMLALKPADFQW